MPKRILIVDDDQADRFLLKRFLDRSELDLQFEECFDGAFAIEYFSQAKVEDLPDLVLLDINMPRMNGIEFLEKYDALLEQRPELRTRFLVMLTSVSRADEEKCLGYEFVVGKVTKSHEQTRMLVDQVSEVLQ